MPSGSGVPVIAVRDLSSCESAKRTMDPCQAGAEWILPSTPGQPVVERVLNSPVRKTEMGISNMKTRNSTLSYFAYSADPDDTNYIGTSTLGFKLEPL